MRAANRGGLEAVGGAMDFLKCARRFLAAIVFAATVLSVAQAQDTETVDPSPAIAAVNDAPTDAETQARIAEIFRQIETLAAIDVDVSAGVVTLSGETASAEAAARAEALAARVNGVVTVENQIERDVSLSRRVAPALDESRSLARTAVRTLPLIALAIAVFCGLIFLGWLVSRWTGFWRRVTPNPFIAELAQTGVRVVFFALAAIAALSLLDATPLLGAFLGAAGVLGLAVGFAIRDTIENYIASIMLSLRQPFRANDHVVIDDHEGNVVRLTSRATVLMTIDGNHLRIPNAAVFKAVILNYTRNPERRFNFLVGIGGNEDPLAAIEIGIETLNALDFMLDDPPAIGVIEELGDSSIVVFFAGWIDQRRTDFAKARSVAISAVKDALETAGLDLPEPVYRVRLDGPAASLAPSEQAAPAATPAKTKRANAKAADTAPQRHIAEMVDEERQGGGEDDLLSGAAPTE